MRTGQVSPGAPLSEVTLRDVTLRDGLQLTGKPLPTATKVAIVRELLAAGVTSIEIGSMARPDLVPALADTLDLVAALSREELESCWVWVATPRHVQRAAEAGVVNFQYCLSVSDSHNQANLGRPTEQSLAGMPEASETALGVGGRLQLCLATAFTCPFEGEIDPDAVLRIVRDPRTEAACDIVVCDTMGQAVPSDVSSLVARIAAEDGRRQVFHGHDTWGLGVANSLAAVHAGAVEVDGALGGLGGCPFAPGAGGNTSSEDLLFALRPPWLTPTAFRRLVELSDSLLAELGEASGSRAARGARASGPSFPWSMSATDGTGRS